MKALIALLIVALLVVVLVVTNPSREEHERIIFERAAQRAGQNVGGEPVGDLGRVLGRLFGGYVSNLGLSLFEYNNYIVCSTMTLNGDLVSFGILEQVFFLR